MLAADGSIDRPRFQLFVGILFAGAGYANGSRYLQGAGTTDVPLYRRLGNSIFVPSLPLSRREIFRSLLWLQRAWKNVLPSLEVYADGFEIETMMNIGALRARPKVFEMASFEGSRIYGTSKLKPVEDGWRAEDDSQREARASSATTPVMCAGRVRAGVRREIAQELGLLTRSLPGAYG